MLGPSRVQVLDHPIQSLLVDLPFGGGCGFVLWGLRTRVGKEDTGLKDFG